MLPGAVEVSRLRAFSGCPRQLPEPELFMLLLMEVPSYAQRLELMVLQEEFSPRLSALRASIRILTDAAEEVMRCEELHAVLHLVLSAGNHLNAGGYAGSAAGFRLASLRRLPDTRANEPGVDLLHFVAMEAARTDRRLLDFPSKLPHVGLASRIEEAEVEAELQRLAARVAAARGPDAASGPGLRPFLRAAEEELRAARAERERMCGTAAAALDFYCEEAAPGALRELCAVLHGFAGRFLNAVQENRAREQAQRRRRQLELQRHKRRSVATCSLRDAEPGGSARPLDAAPALLRRNTAPALPELRGDPESPRPERFPSAPAPSGPASPSRFAALFSRWGSRRAPPAPSGGSALLGFLRRLAGGAARGAPPS
ncbi:FH2 domain-containing protein 1-like isoform X2 [Numida meleagris]|uniref:FH2 domain-containing protein 1-like isoform X2 n=1 Tax=Numida meleagris TaxID=8996 RepID=UPI000B3E3537|nr:FH2 domain-containing protein 1-like isoform X2 [Numida meleagris]